MLCYLCEYQMDIVGEWTWAHPENLSPRKENQEVASTVRAQPNYGRGTKGAHCWEEAF